ncbi:MAG: T9SS type A sorting domain-containing protein [Bacteroidales bacterium]|jgi:hypothetical protein
MKNFLLIITFISLVSFVNAQWQQTSFSSSQVDCTAIRDSNIFVGTFNNGVYLSTDNGSTWTAKNSGLTSTTIFELTLKGDTVFAGTANGVFKSTNNGAGWVAVNTGIDDSTDVNALTINGNNVYAGTDFGVNLSTNYGSSWDTIGLTYTYVISFAISGDTIFAGTGNGVYLSTNNGNSWAAVNKGIVDSTRVYSLAKNGRSIYAGTEYSGLYLSTNYGNNWSSISCSPNSSVIALAPSGNVIYEGTGGKGVYLISGDGSTCTAWNTGLTDTIITSLAINKTTIFAGSIDGRIWKRPLSPLGIEEINNNENNISVYPNPATDNLTIESPQEEVGSGSRQEVVIEISNIQGQLIKTLTATGNKTNIDVSEWPSGMYIVEVRTEKGVEVKKFIKE